MKILATFDARDYEGTTGIYEKYSIRKRHEGQAGQGAGQ